MIHLCRTLLWIFAGRVLVANGDGTAAADLSQSSSISLDRAVATAPNGGSLPHGGPMNLTNPSAVSELNIPPVASSAPSTSGVSAYTNVCDPTCAGAVLASPPTVIADPAVPPGIGLPAAPPGFVSTSSATTPVLSAGNGGDPLTAVVANPPSSIVTSAESANNVLPPGLSSPSSISASTLSLATSSSVRWSNSSISSRSKTTFSSVQTTLFVDNQTNITEYVQMTASSTNYDNCTTIAPDQNVTVWSIAPNTTTITLTITGNYSTAYSSTPEWTPPVYCPETESYPSSPLFSSSTETETPGASTTLSPMVPRITVTFITTAKNPPVITTTALYPSYPSDSSAKESVPSSDTYIWGPATFPGFPATVKPIPITQIINEDNSANTPITYVLDDGVTVMVGSNAAVIGGQTYSIEPSTETITQGADVFTIGPSQVLGPMLVVYVPTAGGIYPQAATTIHGVPIDLGPTNVVVGSSTFAIGTGAPERTAFYDGQTLTFGSGGVIFDQTTVAPPTPLSSNFVIVGGQVFSAIGSTVAVIEGSTFTYGSNVPMTTDVINGDTITIGPSGITFDGSTLGGPFHPSGTQLGIVGGLSITELGSTLAVVDSVTLTIGPNATPTTTVINGHTLTIDSTGLGVGGATLTFPFNPTTQAVTAGGITFSEIGSSVVVIGGSTFTFGPGAYTTTEVYNGQTITLGPNGVGFKTMTLTGTSATHTCKQKNDAEGLRARKIYGVLGTCIVVGVGFLI